MSSSSKGGLPQSITICSRLRPPALCSFQPFFRLGPRMTRLTKATSSSGLFSWSCQFASLETAPLSNRAVSASHRRSSAARSHTALLLPFPRFRVCRLPFRFASVKLSFWNGDDGAKKAVEGCVWRAVRFRWCRMRKPHVRTHHNADFHTRKAVPVTLSTYRSILHLFNYQWLRVSQMGRNVRRSHSHHIKNPVVRPRTAGIVRASWTCSRHL
jgi:hypothetical protein